MAYHRDLLQDQYCFLFALTVFLLVEKVFFLQFAQIVLERYELIHV